MGSGSHIIYIREKTETASISVLIHGCDEDVDASGFTNRVEKLNLLVVVVGISINHTDQQLGDRYLLDIAHLLHDVNSHHAVERLTDSEGVVADTLLDADGIEDVTLTHVDHAVGIDHLYQQADQGSPLGFVKLYASHDDLVIRGFVLLKGRRSCRCCIIAVSHDVLLSAAVCRVLLENLFGA